MGENIARQLARADVQIHIQGQPSDIAAEKDYPRRLAYKAEVRHAKWLAAGRPTPGQRRIGGEEVADKEGTALHRPCADL
eukprot:8249761-Pyramimonas_sp.AAC.1